MTSTGIISSVSRYGMKRETIGPLAKASFEESLDNFLKAGAFGDIEPITGISASIMCAKRSKIGTGICDLVVDVEKSVGSKIIKSDNVMEHIDPSFIPINKPVQKEVIEKQVIQDNEEILELFENDSDLSSNESFDFFDFDN